MWDYTVTVVPSDVVISLCKTFVLVMLLPAAALCGTIQLVPSDVMISLCKAYMLNTVACSCWGYLNLK